MHNQIKPELKYCNKCNTAKLNTKFSRLATATDGFQRWCKACVATYKHKNQHTRKEYNSKYYQTKKYKNASIKRQQKRRATNCIKEKARQLLQRAVATGKIFKPIICSGCGKDFPIKKIQGHHINYNMPYHVLWTCQKCHNKLKKQFTIDKNNPFISPLAKLINHAKQY